MNRVSINVETVYCWTCPICGDEMDTVYPIEPGEIVHCDWCEAKFEAMDS